MNWGDYRRWRDRQISEFKNLTEEERIRLSESLDQARHVALTEALDWIENEAKAICLTRDAARKSWGMRDDSAEKCTGHLVHDEFTICPVHDENGVRR